MITVNSSRGCICFTSIASYSNVNTQFRPVWTEPYFQPLMHIYSIQQKVSLTSHSLLLAEPWRSLFSPTATTMTSHPSDLFTCILRTRWSKRTFSVSLPSEFHSRPGFHLSNSTWRIFTKYIKIVGCITNSPHVLEL